MVNNILTTITSPINELWRGLLGALPGILAMILILIVGYIIALILGRVVHVLLEKLKIDTWLLQKTKVSKLMGKFKLSSFLGLITRWYVFVMFLPAAANAVNLDTWASFLNDLARWIPNLIAGVIIAIVGIVAADYIGAKISETKAKGAGAISVVAKTVIYVFVALMALRQIGVDVRVAESTFLLVIAGIMLALALMFGIGFGLAMKETARGTIKNIKRKL